MKSPNKSKTFYIVNVYELEYMGFCPKYLRKKKEVCIFVAMRTMILLLSFLLCVAVQADNEDINFDTPSLVFYQNICKLSEKNVSLHINNY